MLSLKNTFSLINKSKSSIMRSGNNGVVGTRRLKIYTKTGDKGTSSLYTGERRPKDDQIFEALGTIDELTSFLGEYAGEAGHDGTSCQLEQIQSCLQDVNSNIATPRSNSTSTSNQFKLDKTTFDTSGHLVTQLEHWIDEMDTQLPQLTAFILPSGGKTASTIHVARTICRRGERRVVGLVRDEMADQSCAIYLNRLSDYLFTAARFTCHLENKKETIYKKST